MSIKNIVKGGVAAVAVSAMMSSSVFALCDASNINAHYPNLSTSQSNEYSVVCTGATVKNGSASVQLYGKNQAACAQAGQIATDASACSGDENDLMAMVRILINAIIFAMGMIAVVMIILGGLSYATSQGDSDKVKKGKNTIMYGIIGLVIALLASAIVQFVLTTISA